MRRLSAAVFTVALAAAACGGSDSGTTTTRATGTTGGGTPATTTTAAPSTTTTEALSGPQAMIAGAADYVGAEFVGEWNNTTFGSTGPISITIDEVLVDIGSIVMTVDLGGNVFGQADPDPFTIEIFVEGDGLAVGFSELFEASTIEIGDDGSVTLAASPSAVGQLIIDGMVVEGPDGKPGFEGTYSIPGLADGTWNAYQTG